MATPTLKTYLDKPHIGRSKLRASLSRSPTVCALKRELTAASSSKRVRSLTWFKTGKGDYAEHDRFIGVSVPTLRGLAAKYSHLGLPSIQALLASPIHEFRYIALLMLVGAYQTGNAADQKRIFEFYLQHTNRINNWDLVDTSAPPIVGEHLVKRSRRVLYRLAKSSDLWERRIAMVATSAFIEKGDLTTTFEIAKLLLQDKHDLIHKAVGWMLREAGDRSRTEMLAFLKRNYHQVPRTALRYAIEHLSAPRRKEALAGTIQIRD